MTHYKTLFSEYHQGPSSYIHMLSQPINALRDTAISQDDVNNLRLALDKSEKELSTTLAFFGSHDIDKAVQLNHLAYHAKQSVCFIDCQQLVDKYIGEAEKNLSQLLAQAESKNWILFFDKADALFGKPFKVKDTDEINAHHDVSSLFKRLSQYPGLSILSLTEKSKLESVKYALDSVISFG